MRLFLVLYLVRNFQQGNIPDDSIRELIKAAIYVPSVDLAAGGIVDCNLSSLEIYDCCLDGMKTNGIEINSLP